MQTTCDKGITSLRGVSLLLNGVVALMLMFVGLVPEAFSGAGMPMGSLSQVLFEQRWVIVVLALIGFVAIVSLFLRGCRKASIRIAGLSLVLLAVALFFAQQG